MEPEQRYARYSTEDLLDVERHINRAKFPRAYAALAAEIARREGVPPPERPEPEAPWLRLARRRCRALLLASVLGCAAFFVQSKWLENFAPVGPRQGRSVRLDVGILYPSRVYVTPEQKALHDFLWLFWWPGLPGALALSKIAGPQVEAEEEEEPRF